MAKTEKIFYILEQVRLCLDRKDYIRRASMPIENSSLRPSAQSRLRCLQLQMLSDSVLLCGQMALQCSIRGVWRHLSDTVLVQTSNDLIAEVMLGDWQHQVLKDCPPVVCGACACQHRFSCRSILNIPSGMTLIPHGVGLEGPHHS